MKAIIFNSGLGKRMGEFTKTHHKSMAILKNGETILERQIRILGKNGINEFVITTGPFKEQLENVCKKFPNYKFHFVENKLYDKTNYIYSMYLARNYFDDDFLMLHGDLVFDEELVKSVIEDKRDSICLINEEKKLPEKDFKGRIINNKLKEVSINIFDDDCFAFQPFYKLSKNILLSWSKAVEQFVSSGNVGVYAENALNTILDSIEISVKSYKNNYIDEIDNLEDYSRVVKEIDEFEKSPNYENKQIIIDNYKNLNKIKDLEKSKDILIVCDKFLKDSFIIDYLKTYNLNLHFFTDFNPNPRYEEVLKGLEIFKDNKCTFIIAIGGGSAIDVSKTIRAFSNLNEQTNYLEQEISNSNIPLLAIPTTAGTGSESTHFAVIYFNNKKYSVEHDSILPNYVLLEPKFLESLPLYQKKSTMLDALCQGIESFWSVNSNDKSKEYSRNAIKLILKNYKEYINENKEVYRDILMASNFSGRAINISKTTAAHALSYKITSLYGISHGHAVATCLPYIWEYMIYNMDKVIDKRGKDYLEDIFSELDKMFNCESHIETINKLIGIYDEIGIKYTNVVNENDINLLTDSVNIQRLNNNPVCLNKNTIEKIYRKMI